MFWRRKKAKSAPAEGGVSREEALACKPMRCPVVEVEELDDETVRLCYPLAWRPWFASIARRFGAWDDSPRQKKLELDAMGTTAWRLINGKRSVGEMARSFAQTYGLEQREAELSVSAFLKELGKRGLVAMQEGQTQGRPAPAGMKRAKKRKKGKRGGI